MGILPSTSALPFQYNLNIAPYSLSCPLPKLFVHNLANDSVVNRHT